MNHIATWRLFPLITSSLPFSRPSSDSLHAGSLRRTLPFKRRKHPSKALKPWSPSLQLWLNVGCLETTQNLTLNWAARAFLSDRRDDSRRLCCAKPRISRQSECKITSGSPEGDAEGCLTKVKGSFVDLYLKLLILAHVVVYVVSERSFGFVRKICVNTYKIRLACV